MRPATSASWSVAENCFVVKPAAIQQQADIYEVAGHTSPTL